MGLRETWHANRMRDERLKNLKADKCPLLAESESLACRARALNHPRRRPSETQMQPVRSGLGVSMRADADARFPPFQLSQKIQLGV